MIKLAILGCGGIAQRHLKSIDQIEGARLIATCDLFEERAIAAAEPRGARPYTNWRDMLDKEAPDALLVCTPAKVRDVEIQEAIDRGISLFIEKPAAAAVQTARRLSNQIRQNNAVVALGYMWRYLEALQEAREIIGGRPVGAVRGSAIYPLDATAWHWDGEKSGGQIYDQVTHLLNAVQMFTGAAQTVFATGTIGRLVAGAHVKTEDVTSLSVKYKNGSVGAFINSWSASPTQFVLEFHGEDFSIVVDLGKNTLHGTNGGDPISFKGNNDPYFDVMNSFVEAVRTNEPALLLNPFHCGIETLELTLAAKLSLETGNSTELMS